VRPERGAATASRYDRIECPQRRPAPQVAVRAKAKRTPIVGAIRRSPAKFPLGFWSAAVSGFHPISKPSRSHQRLQPSFLSIPTTSPGIDSLAADHA